MKTKSFIAIAASAALLTFPSAAVASDQDVQATTIPASACQPRGFSTDARVVLSNGAYVFDPSASGTATATFYCSLPINGLTVSNTTNDNDITGYRVYYRDSDGTANASEITTRLAYRDTQGITYVGTLWSSNTNTQTGNTNRYISLNHDLGIYRLYFFVVTMRRTSTIQSPAFSGIDFIFPPVP